MISPESLVANFEGYEKAQGRTLEDALAHAEEARTQYDRLVAMGRLLKVIEVPADAWAEQLGDFVLLADALAAAKIPHASSVVAGGVDRTVADALDHAVALRAVREDSIGGTAWGLVRDLVLLADEVKRLTVTPEQHRWHVAGRPCGAEANEAEGITEIDEHVTCAACLRIVYGSR